MTSLARSESVFNLISYSIIIRKKKSMWRNIRVTVNAFGDSVNSFSILHQLKPLAWQVVKRNISNVIFWNVWNESFRTWPYWPQVWWPAAAPVSSCFFAVFLLRMDFLCWCRGVFLSFFGGFSASTWLPLATVPVMLNWCLSSGFHRSLVYLSS